MLVDDAAQTRARVVQLFVHHRHHAHGLRVAPLVPARVKGKAPGRIRFGFCLWVSTQTYDFLDLCVGVCGCDREEGGG